LAITDRLVLDQLIVILSAWFLRDTTCQHINRWDDDSRNVHKIDKELYVNNVLIKHLLRMNLQTIRFQQASWS